MNSTGNSLESKPGEPLRNNPPATLVWCGLFLVVGIVFTLLGFTQDRAVFIQAGLVISGISAFFGVVRITVWGSK